MQAKATRSGAASWSWFGGLRGALVLAAMTSTPDPDDQCGSARWFLRRGLTMGWSEHEARRERQALLAYAQAQFAHDQAQARAVASEAVQAQRARQLARSRGEGA
jgi:hypothetical protein